MKEPLSEENQFSINNVAMHSLVNNYYGLSIYTDHFTFLDYHDNHHRKRKLKEGIIIIMKCVI